MRTDHIEQMNPDMTVANRQRRFPCGWRRCYFTSKSKKDVLIHTQRVHIRERSLECPHCSVRHVTINELTLHISQRHGKLKTKGLASSQITNTSQHEHLQQRADDNDDEQIEEEQEEEDDDDDGHEEDHEHHDDHDDHHEHEHEEGHEEEQEQEEDDEHSAAPSDVLECSRWGEEFDDEAEYASHDMHCGSKPVTTMPITSNQPQYHGIGTLHLLSVGRQYVESLQQLYY